MEHSGVTHEDTAVRVPQVTEVAVDASYCDADTLNDSFAANLSLDSEPVTGSPSLEMEFQSHPVKLEMARAKDDLFTNNYNPSLLRFWRANMDVQVNL